MSVARRALVAAILAAAVPAAFAASPPAPPTASKPMQPGAETVVPVLAPELAALFPAEANATLCYARKYDASHMAAHPDQKVTGITIRLVNRLVTDESDDMAQGTLFQLEVRRRGDRETLEASGPCMVEGGKVFCGVECDGGGLYAKKRDDGSLLLSFDDMWGIRMTPDCGDEEEDAKELLPGKDDKAFRLDPLPASACPPYEAW